MIDIVPQSATLVFCYSSRQTQELQTAIKSIQLSVDLPDPRTLTPVFVRHMHVLSAGSPCCALHICTSTITLTSTSGDVIFPLIWWLPISHVLCQIYSYCATTYFRFSLYIEIFYTRLQILLRLCLKCIRARGEFCMQTSHDCEDSVSRLSK